MRPLKLRFKGLNNYGTEQTIDFEKLTEQGLFGIFGPTGSGKSTLLDAMTLVLYGEISRKSKEYINTECSEVSIDFTFVLEGKEGPKSYRVERVVKRTKTGGNQCRYARLIMLTPEEEVLAERPSDMKDQVVDLLGLTMEDFTRSVVLPQGKFSEFLKLKGKDRRIMLERIFGLEKYGIGLNTKLRRKYAEKRNEQTVKEELLGHYGDLSKEAIEEKTKELTQKKENAKKVESELKETELKFETIKEVWNLQQELTTAKKTMNEILQQDESIGVYKRQIEVADKASIMMPYLLRATETREKLEEVTLKAKELEKKHGLASQYLEKFKVEIEKLSEYKEEYMPKWVLREKNLKDGINIQGELVRKDNEREAKMATFRHSEEQYKELQQSLNQLDQTRQDLEKQNNVLLTELSDESISAELRNGILDGATLEKELKNKELILKAGKEKATSLNKELEQAKTAYKELKTEFSKLEQTIKERKAKMNSIESMNFLDYSDADKMRVALDALKQKKKDYERLSQEHEKLLATEKKEQDELKRLVKLSDNITEDIRNQQKLLNEMKEIIEEQEGKLIAATLAEQLEEGAPCPVCGSLHHVHKAEHLDTTNVDSLQKKVVEVEDIVNNLRLESKGYEVEIKTKSTQLQQLQRQLKELDVQLKSLGQTSEDIDSGISKIEVSYQQLVRDKKDYASAYKVLQEEHEQQSKSYQAVLSKLSSMEEYQKQKELQTSQLSQENEEKKKELVLLTEDLKKHKEQLDITDFSQAKKELQQKEAGLESKRKQQVVLGKELKDMQTKLEQKQIQEKDLNLDKERLKLTLESLVKDIETEKQRLKALVGDGNPEKELLVLQQEMDEFSRKEQKLNKNYQYSLEKEQSYSVEKVKKKEQVQQLQEQSTRQEQDKLKMLASYEMTEEQVKEGLVEDTKLMTMKKSVEDYDQQLKKTIGYVSSIETKLDHRHVDEEEYQLWQEKKQNLTNIKEEAIKELGQLELSIQNMNQNYEKMKGIIEDKKVIDNELSLLEELTKMFKGNRFIEYVAKNQFQYILAEASKRLYDLSGRYGLEVNDEGEFMIRDDKLGGVRRDASTLSGGETFLTSLALALALSSHIQLKGSYPLEFFFLDEGFGTLDAELLDTVMESLESLNHGKMSVGIISHVEELKDRVPIKLIVEPKEFDGSSIRMEYS